MTCHVSDCKVCAPCSSLELLNVALGVVQGAQSPLCVLRTTLHEVGHVALDREQVVCHLFHELRRDNSLSHGVCLFFHVGKVAGSQLECFTGFFQIHLNVAHVPDRPATLCSFQGIIQSVLADNASDGQAHTNSALCIKAVREQQIRHTFVTSQLVILPVSDFCQHPNTLTALESASGFVGHAIAQQRIGKGERFTVLNRNVFLGRNTQNFVVVAPGDCVVVGNLDSVTGVNQSLVSSPVQTSQLDGLCGTLSALDHVADTMVNSGICGKHRSDIRHSSNLLYLC